MSYSNLPSAPPPAPGEGGFGYGYGPAPRGPRPSTVTNAVRLMFAQVALSLISVVITLATKSDLKSELRKNDPNVSDATINAAVTLGVVIGIVFIVLYALLATQVNKGKNWARIVTWVFAGLGIVSGLVGLGRTEPAATKIFGVIGLIVAIAIVVLLAMKPSNDYFKRR